MRWTQRLIGMGAYDRLVNILSNARNRNGKPVKGQIGADHYPSYKQAMEFYKTLGLDSRHAADAFRGLYEDARRAVNAARRYNDRPGDPPLPALNQLPCPDNPGGRCEDRVEVAGWVEVVDPVSGTKRRVPVVLTVDSGDTRSQIVDRMFNAAMGDVVQRGYDAGGRINPDTATRGTVIIGSISGRG